MSQNSDFSSATPCPINLRLWCKKLSTSLCALKSVNGYKNLMFFRSFILQPGLNRLDFVAVTL